MNALKPLPGLTYKIGAEATTEIARRLGVTHEQATALVEMARTARDGLEFVAETYLRTARNPEGWRGGATRYLLAQVPDRHLVKLTVLARDVSPRPVMPERPTTVCPTDRVREWVWDGRNWICNRCRRGPAQERADES